MQKRRKLLEEEKEKQKEISLRKYAEKDSLTEKIIKHKEEENKLLAEFEALKRKKRREEAKRLEKIRAYQRDKEFERYQIERSKSEMVQEQRKLLLNYKIEENQKIKFIKEKLKEKI